MKIKADFVTNSSSTTYVIEFKQEYRRKDFEEHFTLRTGEYFRLFKDKTSLIKFAQDQDVDWITEVTKKPLMYWGMGQDEFDEAIKILDHDSLVAYLELDRNNHDRTDRAERIIMKNGGLIRHRGND